MELSKKQKVIAVSAGLTVLVVAIAVFFQNYKIVFQVPVHMRFQTPVNLAKRVPVVIRITEQVKAEENVSPLTPDQQYLCNKFGPDCKIALAVQRAENGSGKCDIYNVNDNGSLDWGYFQINTVHLKKVGVNLKDLLDCRANTDFAYKLFKEQGWTPWVAYKNGAYKKYLIN